MAALLERDDAEQERIDAYLDARDRHFPHFAALAWTQRPAPSCGPVPAGPSPLGGNPMTDPGASPPPFRAGAVVASFEEGRPDRCRAVGRHTHTDRMESA